jgi:hypothetical protein
MARARSIKPGFFTNEDLAELTPLARLLFAGLWTIADRDGRLEDRPKRIKNQVLPYDDCNIDDLLECLAEGNFIVRYAHPSGRFISIPTWRKHQNPHGKEAASTIPAPSQTDASTDNSGADRALTLNPEPLTQAKTENEGLSEFEGVLLETSQNLHDRHPAFRSCGPKEIQNQLRKICKKFPANQKLSILKEIDDNHLAWCNSDQWKKQDGEFSKALSNWLAPTEGRWNTRPPPQGRVVNGTTPDYSDPKRYEFGE